MSTKTIMLFIPAYTCAPQIKRVLASLTPEISSRFAEIVVIENRSKDDTLRTAEEGLKGILNCKVTLLQNDENYSLGGSHKVAFNYCLEHGYDALVVLHGDDQGDVNDIIPLLDGDALDKYDTLLGSRFDPASRLVGYSHFRTFGNKVFNSLISLVTRTCVTDMGAGLNAYTREFLSSRFYMNFPNNLTFNVYMLYYQLWKKKPYLFFPLTWKEDDQVSNAKMFRQAWHILILTAKYCFDVAGLFASLPSDGISYSSTIRFQREKMS